MYSVFFFRTFCQVDEYSDAYLLHLYCIICRDVSISHTNEQTYSTVNVTKDNTCDVERIVPYYDYT